MPRLWLALGALLGLLAVALSAWAAHGLPGRLEPARLAGVERAITMQGWHALALLAVGLLAPRGGVLTDLAGAGFLLGLALFCGGVWAGAFGLPALGRAAPAGGMALMAGWALLVAAALRA